ncbi:MAG: nicotinate-nucleotide adenylyltransferase [Bacteroidetes bacterium]|nr:nicotinate-nucleotide adenylyltransferase [Bacteroidota bacterium]
MRIGLFFGSFNPIHVGHMVLANYMLSFTDLQQVWFVVSPHNPLKEKSSLLDQNQRLHMVNLAIGDNLNLKSNNIEFGLPQPSYTINTLAHLKEKYPKHEFALIMGADNLQTFHKWKNYETILDNYKIYTYPRPGFDGGALRLHQHVVMTEAPVMEISSTFIRNAIKAKKDVSYFVPAPVWQYIDEMNFYRK